MNELPEGWIAEIAYGAPDEYTSYCNSAQGLRVIYQKNGRPRWIWWRFPRTIEELSIPYIEHKFPKAVRTLEQRMAYASLMNRMGVT